MRDGYAYPLTMHHQRDDIEASDALKKAKFVPHARRRGVAPAAPEVRATSQSRQASLSEVAAPAYSPPDGDFPFLTSITPTTSPRQGHIVVAEFLQDIGGNSIFNAMFSLCFIRLDYIS